MFYNPLMSDLNELYGLIKKDIDKRLYEFKTLWKKGSGRDVFMEMCFCTCTPQNNAQKAWSSVLSLKKSGLLENGNDYEIAGVLREGGVRFHKNKARYIVTNRTNFYPSIKTIVSNLLNDYDIVEARNYLEKKVYGWGLKEASHFLRNIGFGDKICILDRHILRQLVEYNVIKSVPDMITKKVYLQTESLMIRFAEKQNIPLDAMDLLFWYKEKDELFK